MDLKSYIPRCFGPSVRAHQRFRRGLKADQGATLVETAVATSIVMMLLFGVFDLSLAFYTYHFVSDAAREATRYAIVRGNASCTQTPNLSNCDASEPQITAYVQSLNYPGIDSSKLTVTTTWNTGTLQSSGHTTWAACSTSSPAPDSCKAPGNQVQVTVVCAFPLSIPFWKQTTLGIGSTSAMVISQ